MPGKSRWFNTTFDSAWTQFGNRLHYTLWLWEDCLNFSTTVIQLLGFKVRLCWSKIWVKLFAVSVYLKQMELYKPYLCPFALNLFSFSLPVQRIFCACFHQQVLLWIKHSASSSRKQPCAQVDILAWSLRTRREFICASERKQKWERAIERVHESMFACTCL